MISVKKMNNTIYFYSGTGNSLWTAKNIAELVCNTELISMTLRNEAIVAPASECVGLIFPVHMWGLPLRVIDFIHRLQTDKLRYIFAVAVNAGQVAATLIQLKKILQSKGSDLAAGFSVCLPSNYIPWGGAAAPEKQQELFDRALTKIKSIAEIVSVQEARTPEKGPSVQNIFLSALYRMGSPRIPRLDKSFRVDEKCTGCQICKKVCPAESIIIVDGKPVWQHHCEQCLACIQWCPEEAIQYGKNTATKKRYHHPAIKLQEMMARVSR